MTPQQREALSRELESYRGRWVVLRGAEVVASAATLDELKRSTALEPGDRCLAVRARHQAPYFRR